MARRRRGVKDVDAALAVDGLAPLRRALKRTESGLDVELRKGLKGIGDTVRGDARVRSPVGDGRSGSPGRLKASIRSGVNARGVSVYSNALYAAVQDRGGRIGNGAVILREQASGYMTKAVRDARPMVARRMDDVLDEIGRDFEKTT